MGVGIQDFSRARFARLLLESNWLKALKAVIYQFGLQQCYRPSLSEIPETDVCLCSWCPRGEGAGRTYREESKKAG